MTTQHDYVLADQAGAAFLADLNNAMLAIVGQNSGATEPATMYAYMLWADTASGYMKQRNAANSAWITLYLLASGFSQFPTGTKMLFQQTSAPTGWTKDTTHNNKALRVVSGTAGSGGSVAFTTAFASQAVSGTVDSHTLTIGEIPSHSHTVNGQASSASSPYTCQQAAPGMAPNQTWSGNATGGGGGHTHGFTGTAINLAVQYVDLIIATKD